MVCIMNLIESLLFRKALTEALSYNIKIKKSLMSETTSTDIRLVNKYKTDDTTIANTIYSVLMFGDSIGIVTESDLLNKIAELVDVISEHDRIEYETTMILKDDNRLQGKGSHVRGFLFSDGSSLYVRYTDKETTGRGGIPFFLKPGMGEDNIKRELIKDINEYKRRIAKDSMEMR